MQKLREVLRLIANRNADCDTIKAQRDHTNVSYRGGCKRSSPRVAITGEVKLSPVSQLGHCLASDKRGACPFMPVSTGSSDQAARPLAPT